MEKGLSHGFVNMFYFVSLHLCSLSYLHFKKIVHRDVKTENMLLDAQRTLKIADFGVARVEAQNPRDMTGETGTLGYMAPEVFLLIFLKSESANDYISSKAWQRL